MWDYSNKAARFGGLRMVAGMMAMGVAASGAAAATYQGVVLYPVVTDNPGGPFGRGSTAGGETVTTLQVINGSIIDYEATVWIGGTQSVLPSGGFDGTTVSGTNGVQQVGTGSSASIFGHALLWNGPSGLVVDLQPSALGFTSSSAAGTDGVHQVGNVGNHAAMWSGSAATAVDLEPINLNGITASGADGVKGNAQVGIGYIGSNQEHALLWHGTAASAVDLNPVGVTWSEAYGVGGGEQVGQVNFSSGDHAVMWSGTAASAVDLNPGSLLGFDTSAAYDTNGVNQVGFGGGITATSGEQHAMVWSGTADSAVDLQALLPVNYDWTFSLAYSIDDAGNIFGIARGTPMEGGVTQSFAVEWRPAAAPEPGTILMFGAGALFLGRRRGSGWSGFRWGGVWIAGGGGEVGR